MLKLLRQSQIWQGVMYQALTHASHTSPLVIN